MLKSRRYLFLLPVALGMAALVSPPRVVRDTHPELSLIPFAATFRSTPFSGIAFSFHSNGYPRRLRFFWNGKQTGREWSWYRDGKRLAERRFAAGLEHGIQRGWYIDGKIRYSKSFHSGEPHGEFWTWHPSGTVALLAKYESGEEISYRSWNASGKPFFNYVLRDGERVGLMGETYCDTK